MVDSNLNFQSADLIDFIAVEIKSFPISSLNLHVRL